MRIWRSTQFSILDENTIRRRPIQRQVVKEQFAFISELLLLLR